MCEIERRIEKPLELRPRPKEDPFSWMERVCGWMLNEIALIAFNQKISPRIRLEALQFLLDRALGK